jgi:phosphate:Na+ symporter
LRRAALLTALLVVVAGFTAEAVASVVAGRKSPELDVWVMSMGLVGGLALFLYGMELMADAMKALAADRLKDILARLTTNRFLGALTGAVVTAIIQSSSVTTVLVVGFITAGILSLSQAVGVIFGANIGSTFTAQLIAFKVTKLALLMIALGFGMLFISGRDRLKQYGGMLMGLGLVFFGMGLMSDSMRPLRSYEPFLNLMAHMETAALGILVAAVFTGLIQSSAATTGVVIAMAGQGLITLNAGIALVFGANIGTCVTAILASLGKPREAVRASAAHVLFNVLGVVLWVWFIDPFARLVVAVSPSDPTLAGAAKLAAETPRQVANAHSIFNVVNTLLFLPFATQFARLVEYLIPTGDEPEDVATGAPSEWTTMHLDADLLAVPSIALDQTRYEILRLSRMIRSGLEGLLPAFKANDRTAVAAMLDQEAEIDFVGEQIDDYLVQISRRNLNQEQSEIAVQLTEVTTSLERIGELFKRDLHPLANRKIEAKIPFSEGGEAELQAYWDAVVRNYDKAVEAFADKDTELAREVVRAKPDIAELQQAYRATQYEGLGASDAQTVAASEIHLDLADLVRRIYTYSEAVAYTMLEGFLDKRKKLRTPETQAA